MTKVSAAPSRFQTSPLTDQQCQDYQRDGYLIVRNFFPGELISAAAQEAEVLLRRTELIHTDNIRCRWTTDVNNGACVFETFDPVADLSPVCGRIANHPNLIAAISALYGEKACLFKDKLIFKPSGAKGYALHQDYILWPTFPKSFLTVLVPIDPSTAENGCTEVFAGYHHRGNMSPNDGEYHELPMSTVDPAQAVKMELQPGDIAIFGGFTPHRSSPNLSPGYRRQLYLSYNAISDGGNQRDRHYEEFFAWLRQKYAQYGKNNVYFR